MTGLAGIDQFSKFPASGRHQGRLSLRRNFAWSLGGNAVYAASQWGLLILLAHLEGPKQVGMFSLGLAITAPLFMFASLQLRAVQATDAHDAYSLQQFLALRLITTVAAFAAVLVIIWFGGYRGTTALVIFLVGLGKCFDTVSDILFGLFQKLEQMNIPNIAISLNGVLSIAAFGVSMTISDNLAWGAASWAMASLVTTLFACRAVATKLDDESTLGGPAKWKTLGPDWTFAPLLALARLAFPLGIVVLFISLMTNVPRYVIEDQVGISELGIYAGIAYFVVAGELVVRALQQAAIPRLAVSYAAGKRDDYVGLTLKLVGIGAIGGLLGVVLALAIGDDVLGIVYGNSYRPYANILLLAVIAACLLFMAGQLGAAITAAQKFAIQAPIFGGLLLLTTILSLWLIPDHGLEGAGVVLVIVAIAQVICSGVVVAMCVQAMGRAEPA